MSEISRLGPHHNRERNNRLMTSRRLPGPSRTSTSTSTEASTLSSAHNRKSTTSQSQNAVWIGTHINDLKSLAHLKIFSFLTQDELQTTRRVCRTWLNLINKEFGIKVVVNNANAELVSNCPWINDLILLNLTRPILPQGLLCASRLKSLNISGMVVSYNLTPILESCVHLQYLTFSEPNIDLPDFVILRTLPNNVHLRELKKLTFESWNYTESINSLARVLSSVTFGQLKGIYVKAIHPPVLPLANLFIVAEDEVPEDPSPMVQFIKKNLESVETVSMGTMLSQSVFVFIPELMRPGEPPQLLELSVQNLYMNWTPMLHGQSQMVTLSIGHCQNHQWPEIRSCITRCAGQLETVKLQGRTFGIPWDCDIFAECRSLHDLSLNLALSPKTNLNFLPRTLTHLSLDGPLDRTEFLHLYNLVNLTKLQFNCLGLNFVILRLQNQERNNPPEQIDLNLFLGLLRNLTMLQSLTFKDCSSQSLEWDRVNAWCRQTIRSHPRFSFSQHDYEMHGERIQHGFTLTIPSFYSRSLFLPSAPDQAAQAPGRGVVGNILRFLGLRN